MQGSWQAWALASAPHCYLPIPSRSTCVVSVVALVVPAVADAGQLVGLGMDKRAPLHTCTTLLTVCDSVAIVDFIAVVDAGQLVGLGMDKPALLPCSSTTCSACVVSAVAAVTTPAVVDAGQLVGLGMDTPAPLAQKHSQLSDSAMGQPNSGTTQDSAYISTGAAPASEWHSNGSSIAQPLSAISNPKKLLTPRIFTFGIGPYCNHYFLKRLAGMGLQQRKGRN